MTHFLPKRLVRCAVLALWALLTMAGSVMVHNTWHAAHTQHLQALQVVLELRPQRCSPDGSDVTLPRCPLFPEELTAEQRPIRPGVMLVPTITAGQVYDRGGVGASRPVLSFSVRPRVPGCQATAALANAAAPSPTMST